MMWLTGLLSRRRRYGDLSEEIREHLEEKIEELVGQGMSRTAAEAAARREFGNVTLTKEDSRAVWRWAAIEDFFMDVRFGVRMLRKNPGFTTVAVVTLALGVAANSIIFSLANGLMLRPPRIKDPGRVVAILTTDPAKGRFGWDQNPVSDPDFVAWREQGHSFESMVASELNTFALTGEGEPERLGGMRVTADYFHLLGVEAALGRTFLPGEDQAGHTQVVILSHGLWQRRFAADPNVIGKTLRLDGASYTVAGIMPDGFRVGYYGPQLWTPLAFPPERLLPAGRTDRSLSVLARLKPGVSVESAKAEVATLAQRAEQIHPGTTSGWGATTMVLQKYLADEFKVFMRIQMGAVLVVLLIACANIASLQLSRAAARQTEIAVRTGLGASRFRLVRQLMAESLLVALLGGALGLLLAWWGVRALRNALNWSDYVSEMALAISIDYNVLAYTLGISVLAALLFGLAPAFQQTAVNLHLTLKEGGRTNSQGRARHRAQSALVAAQVALALVLLTSAGLMTWGGVHQMYAGLGLDPKQVLTANIRLSDAQYEEPAKQAAFFQEATERLEALPGVISAGGTTTLLPLEEARVVTFTIEGQAVLPRKDRAKAGWVSITPRYLETLRVPLLRGRSFAPHDNARAPPVAVVNQAFVRRYFPNEEPLGKHLRLDTGDSDRPDWSEIVGVVGNINELSEEWEEQRPQVYESYFQRPSAAMTLVVRTTSDPADFAPFLRGAIWDIDGDQPVTRVQTMEQVIAYGRAAGIIVMTLLGSFAGLALAMAVVGVFGLIAYTVAQRTHEIGIRIALGAQRNNVLRMVVRKGVALGAWGVGIGFALAAPLVVLPTGIAPGMPFDQRASVVLAAGVLLWLVALLASYTPARRVTRIDPTVALRCE
jgi:putative ABC transport system permease protein